jgi:hypothetical protein
MWTLILIVYLTNVNDADITMVRGYATEQACVAAGERARKQLRNNPHFDYLCLPTRK